MPEMTGCRSANVETCSIQKAGCLVGHCVDEQAIEEPKEAHPSHQYEDSVFHRVHDSPRCNSTSTPRDYRRAFSNAQREVVCGAIVQRGHLWKTKENSNG